MKDPDQNGFSKGSNSGIGSAEETLRLIAHLPAPEGLEDRVHAGLRLSRLSAPRSSRILTWPTVLRPGSDWMRGSAAAAIVLAVVGGGWGVYSRVQQSHPAKVIAMPPRVAAPGGFSGAGAMRTPNTLNGPVVANPATAKPAPAKMPAGTAQKPKRRAHPSAAGKAAAQAPAQPTAPAAASPQN
ncbi:MAG: hypothetical protein ABSC88_09455 [Terracidiphilus sp.]|jgi:hypothetical protein